MVCISGLGVLKASDQTNEQLLYKGDSLFKANNYTEAYKCYESLWNQRLYSQQMLLKMAYVKEALGDHTRALYFLNLYYHFEPDMKTLNKMQELADVHDLSGYAFDDYEYFVSIYHRYYTEIAIGGVLLGLLGVGLLFWQKRRGGELKGPAMLVGLFLLLFLIGFNYGFPLERGIVLNDHVFVMSAPSAGADKLTTLEAGHRVKVIEKHDIWYKVEWANKEAFIRGNNLLVVQ
ncbi:MAG: SH3 domain-containing protein [Flammeovirgaceae bacterium]